MQGEIQKDNYRNYLNNKVWYKNIHFKFSVEGNLKFLDLINLNYILFINK